MSSSNASEVIFEYYISKGMSFALDLADKLLQAEQTKVKFGMEDRNRVSGDICEAVLELCLLEYCRNNPDKTKDWFYSKGLVIADIDNPTSEFLTEIDFVLFTNSSIVLFECKSYRGDKKITGNGTIVRQGHKDFDVFSQQALHIETFSKMFTGFRYQDIPVQQCYKAAAFIFAPGSMVDIRPVEVQKVMPFLEVSNVNTLFDGISGKSHWQLSYVRKAVDLIEKNGEDFRRRHLSYVRGLNHSKKSK